MRRESVVSVVARLRRSGNCGTPAALVLGTERERLAFPFQ